MPADTVKSVAPRDEVARELVATLRIAIVKPWLRRVDVGERHVLGLEDER